MSRQTWMILAVVAVAGVAAFVSLNTAIESPAPVVERVPAKSFPEPARDTSAPAAAKAPSPRVSAPKAPAPTASATPEPVVPAAPTTATLHITSDVPGAQVFVDRKFIGVAPATAEDIAPGSRQINVSAPGYDGVAETIDVVPGPRDVMISLKTIRLDQSVPVTHKHGMGSCSGQLLATPDGIRYVTDNKNDGFSVPLTGLETFKMDFLAKTLKIKVKGGRSYDFTDPGGKAEPLYFFHEAVEKARARMAKGPGATQEAR